MYRLFVAISLPPALKQNLLALCCGVPGARWSAADQMHLTLSFIGEVDGKIRQAVIESLENVTGGPIPLTPVGVGHFPPRGEPRILWSGFERSDQLAALKNRVDQALRRVGIEVEKRKFHPHVTLARLRGAHHSRVGGFLVQNGLFRAPTFVAEEFHLFSSNLHSDGARYEIEVSYPLKERSDHEDASKRDYP